MKLLPRVLVLGLGPIAQELAIAYSRLGCESAVGELADASGFDIVIAADDAVDAGRLGGVAKQLPVVPAVGACALAFDRAALREKACDELGLPTLTYQLTPHSGGARPGCGGNRLPTDYEAAPGSRAARGDVA